MPITIAHGTNSVNVVEGVEEFNLLLPSLSRALEANRNEWGYTYTKDELLSMMNGNHHRLCFVGDVKDPKAIAFFNVEGFSTYESQVELVWSWARDELFTSSISEFAKRIAIASNAKRIRVFACKHLAKELAKIGFKRCSIEMVMDYGRTEQSYTNE